MSGASGTYEIIASVTTTPSATELRRISRRAAAVAPSATLAVDAKAKALQAAGEHVIGFGAGEPDFPTPAHIVEAAVIACREPANHRYTPTGGIPALREAIAAKTLPRLGLRGGGQPGARDQRRQAGRGQRVRGAVRPGRRGARARPLLDDLPRIDRARRRYARRRVLRRDHRLPLLGRGPRARLDAAHQGAALRVAVQPDRRRVPAARNRGHRPVGGVQGHLGADRRDLRAPRLRRSRASLHAGGRARAGRPLPGGQRRGQDLRHDRLAGRVADRAERRHQCRHQHPEPRDVQRRQRVADAPRWRPCRATSTPLP